MGFVLYICIGKWRSPSATAGVYTNPDAIYGYLLSVSIVLLRSVSPFQCICWEHSILCSIVFVCMLMSWFAFVRP